MRKLRLLTLSCVATLLFVVMGYAKPQYNFFSCTSTPDVDDCKVCCASEWDKCMAFGDPNGAREAHCGILRNTCESTCTSIGL